MVTSNSKFYVDDLLTQLHIKQLKYPGVECISKCSPEFPGEKPKYKGIDRRTSSTIVQDIIDIY